jgi:DNA-binding GntR family transcriptional regulator
MTRISSANPPSTLRAHVVQRLREDILSGRYKPGDRLNESLIAREFQMSRIPVREALFELREVGLVMSHERRGMFVTSLSEEEIQQINAVRIILEAEAFRLARRRMSPKSAAVLETIVAKMENISCNVSEAAALDLEFHRAVWSITGNEYLTTTLDSLAALSFAHNMLERVGPSHREWRLNHHRALLDVLLDDTETDEELALKKHFAAAYFKEPSVEKSTTVGTMSNGLSSELKGSAIAKRKKPPSE